MKDIKQYIQEKYLIDQDTFINTDKDEITNIVDIVIAAYLSIKRLKCWIEGSTFQKRIKYIKYEDILSILNDDFNYNYNKSDIKIKTGSIWKIVKQYLISIQNLENYHNVILKIDNNKITLNYKELDEKYKNILHKK